MRKMFAAAVAIGLLAGAPTSALAQSRDLPAEWDGLVKVKSKRADTVYLLPGADFRQYSKIIIDEPEVAVDQRWLKDYNRSVRDPGGRLSDADVQQGIASVRDGFRDGFTKRLSKAGYEVVSAPGPDVMRMRPAVINLQVSAPDTMSAGRTRSYSREAGRATVVLELRDSVSNALLGRAIDTREIGDVGFAQVRNSVTNKADFEREFERWADSAVKGLEALKENSPLNPGAAAK